MIASQFPDLAGKLRRAIRKEQLGLADAAGVEQQHPGGWMAGVVLEIESQFTLAHGNPRRLAAPAAVDYLGLERQHFANHGHRFGAFCSSRRAVNVRLPTRILSMPNTNRPTISTHVLDTSRGEPASGVAVTLWRLDGESPASQGTRGTDADGRVGGLTGGARAGRGCPGEV